MTRIEATSLPELPAPPTAKADFTASPEFPLYAALKLYACERMAQRPDAAEPPCFTARRIHHIFVRSRTGPCVPELFGVSSYFVRERLRVLNHGTALREVGRGLRNSIQYRWHEPFGRAQFESFQRVRDIVGDDVHLTLDLHRIGEAFGDSPFGARDYLRLIASWRGRVTSDRQARLLARGQGPKALAYWSFLRRRLENLCTRGLVEESPEGYSMTPAGKECMHWFHLFMHSVDFPAPSRKRA